MLESRDQDGLTPLQLVAELNHAELVKVLLDADASCEPSDSASLSAFQIAASAGNREIMMLLAGAETGLDISQNNGYLDSTPNGVEQSSVGSTIIRLVFALGDDLENERKVLAGVLLATFRPSVSKQILDCGASPNLSYKTAVCPIIFAAKCNILESVKYLEHFGANVNQKMMNAEKSNALYLAIKDKSEDMVRYLLDHSSDPNCVYGEMKKPLVFAASIGHAGNLQALLDAGSDYAAICLPDNWTALHIASANGQRIVLKLLIQRSCDLRKEDSCGRNLLTVGREAGHESIIYAILDEIAETSSAKN